MAVLRIITITAVDSEGGVGQESIITVVFSRTCTVWSGESPIEIPSDISLDELSICTSVPNFGIRVTGNVDSLKPLTNLQVILSFFLLIHCSFIILQFDYSLWTH